MAKRLWVVPETVLPPVIWKGMMYRISLLLTSEGVFFLYNKKGSLGASLASFWLYSQHIMRRHDKAHGCLPIPYIGEELHHDISVRVVVVRYRTGDAHPAACLLYTSRCV